MYKYSIRSYMNKIFGFFNNLKTNPNSSNISGSQQNGDEIEKQPLQLQQQQQNESPKKSDFSNICFLFFLYLLQGVPLGLTASLPYILSSKKASYSDQGTFSLATWPFSLKLLWAPLVDSLWSSKFGRRKSWLVPIQYLLGIFMLMFANYVHLLLEDESIQIGNDIYVLTAIFFLFTFLAATQDIAVDGWGLTILSKENMAWASICNNAGSTTGLLIGNSLFLVLESTSFSNIYIRPILGLQTQKHGLVNLKEFMQFFGFIFIASTTLILLFKKEKNLNYDHDDLNDDLSIHLTFKSLWEIIRLVPIQRFLIILFTCKIAFATSIVRSFKLIEAGVSKEKLGLMNAPFHVIQILTPVLIGKIIDMNKPFDLFIKVYPWRMIVTVVLTVFVFITPLFKDRSNNYPTSYFLMYIFLNGIYAFLFSAMALSKTSFFTKISDKSIGGTYMTLLNTIANIGNHWPITTALYLVDTFTNKACSHDLTINWDKLNSSKKKTLIAFLTKIEENKCSTTEQAKNCAKNGAKCVIIVDAFYLLTGICIAIGIIWFFYYRKQINNLQLLSKSSWKIGKINVKKPQIL